MEVHLAATKKETSQAAARTASQKLQESIRNQGTVNLIVATGSSQFDLLKTLTDDTDINWKKTTMFHLDEYIGIPETHPASFRKYLKDRFVEIVQPGTVYFLYREAHDPQDECNRLNNVISDHLIDVAFVGIGENGHLAFNDPPADFETDAPYTIYLDSGSSSLLTLT